MMQGYRPSSVHENDEVEDLSDIIKKMLEEDRLGETNTILLGAEIVLLEMIHIETLLDHIA
jgi:hypothetical protein